MSFSENLIKVVASVFQFFKAVVEITNSFAVVFHATTARSTDKNTFTFILITLVIGKLY